MKDPATRLTGLPAANPSTGDRHSTSGRGAGDLFPALTRRVAYLEGRLATTQGDLDAARRRIAAYAEAEHSLNDTRGGTYRSADEIRRRAQVEADEILEAANEERRSLSAEVQELRGERQALEDEISALGRGEQFAGRDPIEPRSSRAPDPETAVMEEMRLLLLDIVREARARSGTAPAAAERVVDKGERAVAVAQAKVIDEVVEHVEELVRPDPTGPIEDEYVEELRS